LRIKGEIVDMVGEPTAFIKEWDKEKQEVVLRCGIGSFVETFRVVPEKPTGPQTQIPAQPPAHPAPNGQHVDPLSNLFRESAPEAELERARVGSTLDTEKLVAIENKLRTARIKRIYREEIEANQRRAAQQERTTP
jgi:hypothetical protein